METKADKTPDAASRVILLGLDGGTYYLLKPWVDEGLMPNLGRLMERSVWGDLESTIPATTPPAWSTCVTGKHPGKHGIYDFRESFLRHPLRPLINSGSIRARKLWEILADHGKRSGLVSVPITYPPMSINGFVISGLLTPDGESRYTTPPELKNDLLKGIGDFVVNIDIPKYDTDALDDALAFLDEVLYSLEKRRDAFFHLMSKEAWDFFMIVFIFADRIQHLFWKYIDPQTKLYSSPRAGQLRDRILKCYRTFDEMLDPLERALDDDTQLFIMSDHGFGATRAWINVNTYLARQGWLKLRRGKALHKSLFTTVMNVGEHPLTKRLLPEALQRKIRGRVRATRSSFKSDVEAAVDWEKTRAFFASIPTQGVYINIKRDDFGVVEPGAEYEGLRAEIKEKLLALRDPWTGEAVIDRIWFKEEIYQGPQARYAPDLVFVAREYAYLGRQLFGDHKIIRSAEDLPVGFHRSNGIFLAHGSMIREDLSIEGADIADIAPTILYTMGLPVPDDMDGTVRQEIFREGIIETRPVAYAKAAEYEETEEQETYSEEETEKIKDRLRSLGYIE
jgi:predicted AlkP superfamily phosphohydrolase/phosphomutase